MEQNFEFLVIFEGFFACMGQNLRFFMILPIYMAESRENQWVGNLGKLIGPNENQVTRNDLHLQVLGDASRKSWPGLKPWTSTYHW